MRVEALEVQLQAHYDKGRDAGHGPVAQREVGRLSTGGVGALNEPAVAWRDLAPTQRVDAVQLSAAAHAIETEHRKFPLDEQELAPQHELKLELAKKLVEQMLGARFKLVRPVDFMEGTRDVPRPEQPDPSAPAEAPAEAAAGRGGRVDGGGRGGDSVATRPSGGDAPAMIEASFYSYHAGGESGSVQASALVHTRDGAQLEVAVQLRVGRSFAARHGVNPHDAQARLRDPLAVDFAGSAEELPSRRLRFELDADGTRDQIALTGQGGALTGLDHSGDGKIDDSAELASAIASDGFSGLGRYDHDDDSLPDASRTVYDGLRLWSVDQAGERDLMALGAPDLGAVYVGHIQAAVEAGHDTVGPARLVPDSGLSSPGDEQPDTAARRVDLVA